MMKNKEYISIGNIITKHIQTQITKLHRASLVYKGWNEIIFDYDNKDEFSSFTVFDLRIKAFYLERLYIMASPHGNFKNIAALALVKANKDLNVLGTDAANHHIITNYHTLLIWFRAYRDTDSFPNSSKLRPSKSKLPYSPYSNPDVCEQIISYCKDNLSTLSMESVFNHLHDQILPKLVQTIQKERNELDYTKRGLLKEYHIKQLTMMTVYNWMTKHLGFKYKQRRKCYYVDNHEKTENIKYRREFIDRYFAYKIRCHRWIHISAQERESMIFKGELDINSGYKYQAEDATTMYEYHCDDHI